MSESVLRLVLLAISAVTVVSGLTQWVAPRFVLSYIAGTPDALSLQSFATIGMFMVITGALFFQSLRAGSYESLIPFWISAQKLFAAALVGVGVYHGVFKPLALAVGGFDALSSLFAFMYWRRLL